jgi:hypothetical protein
MFLMFSFCVCRCSEGNVEQGNLQALLEELGYGVADSFVSILCPFNSSWQCTNSSAVYVLKPSLSNFRVD